MIRGRVVRQRSRDEVQWQRRPQGEARASVGPTIRDAAAREVAAGAAACSVAAAAPCEDPQEPSPQGRRPQETWVGVGATTIRGGSPVLDDEDPALSATLPGHQAGIGAGQVPASSGALADAGIISRAAAVPLLRMGVPAPGAAAIQGGVRRGIDPLPGGAHRGALSQPLQRTVRGTAAAAPLRRDQTPPGAAAASAVSTRDARCAAPCDTLPGGGGGGSEGDRRAQLRAPVAFAASGMSLFRGDRHGGTSTASYPQAASGGVSGGDKSSLQAPLSSSSRPVASVARQGSHMSFQQEVLLRQMPVTTSAVAVRGGADGSCAAPQDASDSGGGRGGGLSLDDEYADESFEEASPSLSPPHAAARSCHA